MSLLSVLILLVNVLSIINGHGYMVSPPARNSMWRYGFPNPANYNDNQLFCGGRYYQIQMGGRCGICGDPAGKSEPHMDGGKYANNIIGMTYRQGQTITVQVLLTASHKGYFEFRIGEYDNSVIRGDNFGKLRGFLLKTTNGQTKHKVEGSRRYSIQLVLPPQLKCKRCVMQWWYRTGNSWGCDREGCGLGHGDQEHFVNCADVSIL